jgi:N4-gp56 family major capsid protein
MSVSGIQTTSTLTYARWAKYLPEYIRAAAFERLYDSLAMGNVIPDERMSDLWRSSSINLEFLSELEPGTETIPEDLDVRGNALRDASFEITPTSRFGLIEASEKLMNSAGTNYASERFYILGQHHARTIDLIAQERALTGSMVVRAAARTSLDAGTAGHLLSYANFTAATVNLQDKQVPGFRDADRTMWFAIMHPFAFADLRNSTPILQTAQYQKANIILKYELGELGPFKLIVSPNAKVFYGGGAANASAIETTLNGAVKALDKTIVVAANTNIDVGDYIMIGTHETGDTHYATNERVSVTSVASTTIGVAGGGPNGGLKYDHASGVAVSNDDNVATVVFGGPRSLAKVYDPQVGEYGEVLPPKRVGALDHIYQLGWKWYGNYSRWNESMLIRQEVAVSNDA